MLENLRILGMEMSLFHIIREVCRVCERYLTSFLLMGRKQLTKNGLMPSVKSGWRGGSPMTGAMQECCLYILRDIRSTSKKLFHAGLRTTMVKSHYEDLKINTIMFKLKQKQEIKYLEKLENIYQNVCDISLSDVEEIIELEVEKVYDINVDKTHCFFANNILVHNCQHWASETCQVLSEYSVEAKYRAMESAVSEIVWILGISDDLGMKQTDPVELRCDSKVALQIATKVT